MNLSIYDKLNILEDEIDGQEEIDVSGHNLRDARDEIDSIDDELMVIVDDLYDTVSGKMEITSVELAQILLKKLEKLRERLY